MVNHIRYTPELANDWKQASADVKKDYPHQFRRTLDASTSSQLESKLWAVTELLKLPDLMDSPRVALIGGWFANYITPLLIDGLGAAVVFNYEIDQDAKEISYKYNKRYKDSAEYQCSVKGPKAQLMSGEQKETRATILAALELSGKTGWLKKQLMEEVDKFVTSTRTVGEELNGRILKQMSVKDVKEYDKELLKKKRIDSLKDGNTAAKKIIDSQEKMKATITSTFEKAFSNKGVGGAFAYESMTGYEKFGGHIFGESGDKSGEASHMIIWNYSMDQLRWQKLTPKYAAKVSTKMKVRPDLKTNSYSKKVNGKKQKLGYSFYQSLRVSVETIFKETDKLQESFYYDLIDKSKILSEGKLTDWIKNTWNKIKEKIKNMWLWFNEKIMELKNVANEIINTDVESTLNFFELDVTVKVNTEVTL